MNRELTKEEREAQKRIIPNKLCLHCVHRKRNPDMFHAQIYCEMQPSKRSKSGFATIKAHDSACGLYEQRL